MNENLGVRVRAKGMSLPDELLSESLIVVDLAVEHELDGSIFVGHRLAARLGKIDDRKSAMPQSDAAVRGEPLADAVGPSSVHVIADDAQFVSADLRSDGMISEEGD
jgi:hypothetical protein